MSFNRECNLHTIFILALRHYLRDNTHSSVEEVLCPRRDRGFAALRSNEAARSRRLSQMTSDALAAFTEGLMASDLDLIVEVNGSDIVITMSRGKARVTYRKSPDTPQLVVTPSSRQTTRTPKLGLDDFAPVLGGSPTTPRSSSAGSKCLNEQPSAEKPS